MLPEKKNNGASFGGVEKMQTIVADKKIKKEGYVAWLEFFDKYFSLIGVVAFILFFLVGAYWLFGVYDGSVGAMTSLIGQKEKLLAEKKKQAEDLQQVKINYENLGEAAKKIFDAMPADKDLPDLLIQLESLAQKNNLAVKSIDFSDPADKDKIRIKNSDLNKLVMNLVVTGGDYFTLKNFLIGVEKNIRLLDVKSIAYSPEENIYNIVLNAYYLSDKYDGAAEK